MSKICRIKFLETLSGCQRLQLLTPTSVHECADAFASLPSKGKEDLHCCVHLAQRVGSEFYLSLKSTIPPNQPYKCGAATGAWQSGKLTCQAGQGETVSAPWTGENL